MSEISDATVYYPKGLYKEDYPDFKTARNKVADGDGGDKTFLLSEANMVSLNRFLWTGKLLSETRSDYSKSIGIIDESVISSEVWGAVDSLLGTYKEVKVNCTTFMDTSFPKIRGTADDIYNYAVTAGGKEDSSYYVVVLNWLKKYSDEKKKASPDQSLLAETRSNIQGVCQDMMDHIATLQKGASDAYTELTAFHGSCKGYSSTLTGDKTTMNNLLAKEGNDIKALQGDIDNAVSSLKDYQKEIDLDHKRIADTEYYVWIPAVGMIAAAIVVSQANADIEKVKKAMASLQETLDQDEAKMQTAVSLQTDTSSMSSQITTFVDQIGPALTTLERLQAAWHDMSSDLQNISDLVAEEFTGEVPSMGIGTLELNKIIEEWNTLRDDVQNYRSTVYLTDNPAIVTPKEYNKELQDITGAKFA